MKNSKLQFKIQNYLKLLVFITLNFALLTCLPAGRLFGINVAHAQTVDPTIWQTQATGLQTTSNADQKTAGLTTTVKTSGIPFLLLQGGVVSRIDRAVGPVGIELGEIKVPGTSPALAFQSADWAHNEMTFSNNLKLWVSRLSPSLLIQNQNTSLRLFSGNLKGVTLTPGGPSYNPVSGNERTPAPSYPKYVAFSSGGSIQIRPLSSTDLILPALDNNWILIWYGNNSHFVDTKVPLSVSNGAQTSAIPFKDAFQADTPMLLKFQNNPTTIKHSTEGGVDLTFASNAGYLQMLPLYGRDHLTSATTEAWVNGLPAEASGKINFWVNHLCSYPTSIRESYAYDKNTDRVTITENVTYVPVCNGGTTFAILPPILSLAKDAMGISVNGGSLTDPSYPTEFGPLLGIEGVNAYSWSLFGLKKFTDNKRVIVNPGSAPAEAIQKLASEVDKLIQNGHYSPWIFTTHLPHSPMAGEPYFHNPADTLYHLSEVAMILPEPQKTNLINYLKNERTNFPPETEYRLPATGTLRDYFGVDGSAPSNEPPLNWYQRWERERTQLFYTRLPLYNFYALSKYYQLTGESVPSSVLNQAKVVLNQDMAEQDWATFSWFKGKAEGRVAVINANRHLTGMIGFIQVAKAAQDNQAENLGRALLAKAAISRVAMAKYPRYLYTANLTVLPQGADWMPRYIISTGDNWQGYIFNYNWAAPYDDHRQVTWLDQFGIYLYDHSGYMTPPNWYGPDWPYVLGAHLTAYRELVPEAFRLLTDFAKQDAEIYLKKYESFSPQWYVPYAEGVLGGENDSARPIDSFQLFMAKALMEKDNPQNLERYSSFSWLESGDLFYMQKLAETIKAYQGWRWEDEPVLGISTKVNPSSQPPTFNLFKLIKTTFSQIFKEKL